MMKKVTTSGPMYAFKTSLCIFFIFNNERHFSATSLLDFFILDYTTFFSVCLMRLNSLTHKDSNFIAKNNNVSTKIIAGPEGTSA